MKHLLTEAQGKNMKILWMLHETIKKLIIIL
jgi:hypothetical protein